MTIIQRQSVDAAVFDVEILNALRKVYGMGDYVNTGITHVDDFTSENTNKIRTKPITNIKAPTGDNRIFDMNGNLVRGKLRPGSYISKQGGTTTRFNVK